MQAPGGRVSALIVLVACGCATPARVQPAPVQVQLAPGASETPSLTALHELQRLARVHDPSAVPALVDALSDPRDELRLFAARALADYPASLGETPRKALLWALGKDKPELVPAIAWALLSLREARAASALLPLIAEHRLEGVTHLDGSPAFNAWRVRKLGAALVADKDTYARYLLAVRDGLGGAALLAELQELPSDPELAWHKQGQ